MANEWFDKEVECPYEILSHTQILALRSSVQTHVNAEVYEAFINQTHSHWLDYMRAQWLNHDRMYNEIIQKEL